MVPAGRTVLYVEDEVIIALAKKRELESCGYDVVIANSGEKAVKEAVGNDKIDLVLMDIDLGRGMDGSEAAQEILKERQIPIIFMSSHEEPEVVRKTESIGSYGYVVKNSSVTVLDASIRMAFRLFEANKIIESQRNSLEITLNSIGDGIIVTDGNGAIVKMNPVVERLTGWAADEAEGMPVGTVVNTRQCYQKIISVIESGDKLEGRYAMELVSRKGERFYVESSVAPVKNGEENIKGAVIIIRDVTEKVTLKKALELSEEKFRIIIEQSPESIVFTDTEGTIEYVNPAFCSLTGYEAGELKGRNPRILKSGRTPKSTYDALWSTISSGKIWKGFFTNRKKDGSIYEESAVISPIRGDDGFVMGFVGIKRDLSKEKHLENELASQKRRLENIIFGSNAGTWEWDINTGHQIVNDKWCEKIGYTQDELSPVTIDTWRKLIHPDDVEKAVTVMNEYLSGKRDYYESEFRMKHKTGKWIWILSRGRIVERDADGNPVIMAGTHTNVTHPAEK